MSFPMGWNIHNFISPGIARFWFGLSWLNSEHTKVADLNSCDFIVFTQHFAHCFKDGIDKLEGFSIGGTYLGGRALADVSP